MTISVIERLENGGIRLQVKLDKTVESLPKDKRVKIGNRVYLINKVFTTDQAGNSIVALKDHKSGIKKGERLANIFLRSERPTSVVILDDDETTI